MNNNNQIITLDSPYSDSIVKVEVIRKGKIVELYNMANPEESPVKIMLTDKKIIEEGNSFSLEEVEKSYVRVLMPSERLSRNNLTKFIKESLSSLLGSKV